MNLAKETFILYHPSWNNISANCQTLYSLFKLIHALSRLTRKRKTMQRKLRVWDLYWRPCQKRTTKRQSFWWNTCQDCANRERLPTWLRKTWQLYGHRICSGEQISLVCTQFPRIFRPPPTLNGADAHLLSGLNVHTAICDFFIENADALFINDIDEGTCSGIFTFLSGLGLEQSKCTSVENSFTTISKSATMSDMRSESESKWPRFFRGKSVEGFWKFNRKQQTSTGELCGSPTSEVKWRRFAC